MSTFESFAAAWELFRAPILCAAIAGAVLGFLGVYLVLCRMVFVSAAVSQAAGLGVAVAFYADVHWGLSFEPALGAAVFALAATLLFSSDPGRLGLPQDTLVGVAFAAAGGAAVLTGDRIAQEAHELNAILFGTAVLVRPLDLVLVAGVGAAVLLLHVSWMRAFLFASFDGQVARAAGLPVRTLNALLFVSVGAMVGVSARALGALPVFAFSVLPAVAALLLGARVPFAFAIAAASGALCGVAGYVAAFFLDLPVGASQATSGVVWVALALLASALVRWRKAVARAVAVGFPLLACLVCPVCLTAGAGVLSALGVGWLVTEDVHRGMVMAAALTSSASALWLARRHRRPWPPAMACAGALAVLLGCVAIESRPLELAGTAEVDPVFWTTPIFAFRGSSVLKGAVHG